MALQKAVTTVYGEERECYLRVEDVNGDKNYLYFMLRGYLSREAANHDAREVWACDYGFAPQGNSRWDKQAYEFLKTLPEYVGAADVMEAEAEA